MIGAASHLLSVYPVAIDELQIGKGEKLPCFNLSTCETLGTDMKMRAI
uniref:Uncharacterized protein n=1 Tax=Zea mays TaxID=4577 RepID=B6SGS4_MAIZE|nr:hypothetical protein [Zea mays]